MSFLINTSRSQSPFAVRFESLFDSALRNSGTPAQGGRPTDTGSGLFRFTVSSGGTTRTQTPASGNTFAFGTRPSAPTPQNTNVTATPNAAPAPPVTDTPTATLAPVPAAAPVPQSPPRPGATIVPIAPLVQPPAPQPGPPFAGSDPQNVRVTESVVNGQPVVTQEVIPTGPRADTGLRIVGEGGVQNLIFGGQGNDLLSGREGNDTIAGRAGNDDLSGFGGDDLLFGGQGDDVLNGDQGDDSLTGGIGRDTFEYSRGITGGGNDVITDFDITQDRLSFNVSGLTNNTLSVDPEDLRQFLSTTTNDRGENVLVLDFGNGDTLSIVTDATEDTFIKDVQIVPFDTRVF